MRFLFLMDPPSTVLVDADTSFALMIEAQERGHRVDHALIQELFVRDGRVGAHVRKATMARDAHAPIVLGEAETVMLSEIDAVFVRKDPPFDGNYLWATQLLELARGDTLLINDPRGLREANEKLYALNFLSSMPKTIVDSHKQSILDFAKEMGGQVVIKPLSGAGGDGIFLLRSDDLNAKAIVETVTQNGTRMAMVQEFLPAVREGDKRILLLNGEPLGGLLRVPKSDDVRSNIHVGGSVAKTDLTAEDLAIVKNVREKIILDGLIFVGLDVIGGKLTEVNVTSPTGIQQMSRLNGVNLSAKVIEWVEAHA